MCARTDWRYMWAFSAVLVVSALLMGQGCPVPGGNSNPTANAGSDQNVNGGSTVTLDGSASSDPDGDPLSFSWTQTAGTAVTLSGATTATPSFTAPNTTETLSFQLTVNDGQGGSDSDTVNFNVTAVANLPPVADAGADQSVSAGDTVTLDGSGSSDPDGDPLSYSWTQTSGTAVTLSGANTATASFTAPAVTETLTFQLTVNDGVASDSDTVNINVTASAAAPTLYIANFLGNNVTAYDVTNPSAVNGNIAPDANLAGAQTQLFQPSDIIIDAGGALLASNFNTASITGYNDAITLASINGNIAPTRNVQGAATQLTQPTSLTVNTNNDLVFVADISSDDVYVFANASTAAFNGNLPPTRTIQSVDLNNPFGINLDGNDNLYVANNGTNAVTVFANASTLNGNVAATRTLTSATFVNLYDVYVDPNDTAYVVSATGRVDMFFNAVTKNGAVTPDVSLVVQGALFLTAIAVDSNGTAYIVDNTANAVYSYDNITTRNGTLPPDRTLTGANTQLVGPIRVYLLE